MLDNIYYNIILYVQAMKVYFTTSQRGKGYFDQYYIRIYNEIKRLGHTHLDDEIVKVTSKEFYNELEEGGSESYKKLYKSNIKNLHSSDINFFEVSIHSLSVGFMINKSIEINKPTIALYLKGNNPLFLSGIEGDKFIILRYCESNLERIVKESLEKAKKL